MLLMAHNIARVVFSQTQATDLSPLVVLTMLWNPLVSSGTKCGPEPRSSLYVGPNHSGSSRARVSG